MIGTLNALVDLVDAERGQEIDIAAFARAHGTTEYHLRRMFSALAGMSVTEYVRRRRMTLAGASSPPGRRVFSTWPSGTATARPRLSAGRSAPCTASDRPTRVDTGVLSAHNPRSGSA